MNKKILFAVQYPEDISPGQRFRFEQYIGILRKNNLEVSVAPFMDKAGYDIIHKPGFLFAKFYAVVKGFLRRLGLIFSIHKYDFIFLQREFAPIGPPFFEWLFARVYKAKIVYDFDDAIWMQQNSEINGLAAFLKNSNKVKAICKWAYKVSCGNDYLCKFALKYNSTVIYNPTCVDTETRYNIICDHDVERVTIGWTGSFSSLEFLYLLIPVFKKLQENYDFDIKIICNQDPQLGLKNVKYIEWTPENEVTELAACQIGLMPLKNNVWSEGKCGFKLIQYFALEIPAVSSSVGVNKIIIEDGINGFLADSESEWYEAIEKLILDPGLRKRMGKNGRRKIVSQYSIQSNEENMVALFT